MGGAESVLTRRVPSYAIYAGNPVHLVKLYFLLPYDWKILTAECWEWNHAVILKSIAYLCSTHTEAFVKCAASLVKTHKNSLH